MSARQATAIVTYHRTEDALAFAAFAERLGAGAQAAPHFKVWQHSVLESPELDWSIAVTFHDEDALHAWVDAAMTGLDDEVHRHPRIDLITDGSPRTEGVLLREEVRPGREQEYIAAAERLVALERSQPGYEGSSVFPTFDGVEGVGAKTTLLGIAAILASFGVYFAVFFSLGFLPLR